MVTEDILNVLNNACEKLNLPTEKIVVMFSNMPNLCDYQCNSCFQLAKLAGVSPIEIAEKIVDEIGENENFTFVAAKPGYVNISLKQNYLSKLANELLADEKCGVKQHQKKLNVLMDYGGANVAKELHIGHLCSPIIGEGVKRLYRLLGHNVISDAHLGDWGLQMGLTILQLKEDGILEYYFSGNGEEPTITLDMTEAKNFLLNQGRRLRTLA